MEKLKFIISFICFLIAISCTHKRPIISFDKKEIAFSVKKGDSVLLVYNFKNVGNDSLKILNVQADCGCTSVQYPKTSIPPGGGNRIIAIFNSDKDTTNKIIARSIIVESNTKPILNILYLRGVVQ